MRIKTKRRLKKVLKIAIGILVVAALVRFVPELVPQETKQKIMAVFEAGKKSVAGVTEDGMKALGDLYEQYMSQNAQDVTEDTGNPAGKESVPLMVQKEEWLGTTGTGGSASAGQDRLKVAGATSGGLEIPRIVAGHQIVTHPGYTLSYNEEYEQPDWVAYVLTVDELNTNVTGRTENFREDPSVVTGSAHLTDYRNSGYDRGHLIPSADRTSSVELNDATFLLSNMSPQIHRFNAGLWLKAEDAVRDAARKYGTLYVTTGPVFTDGMKTIGECDVAVPESFYKVLLAQDKDGNWISLGLVCPQEYKDGTLKKYLTTVNEVEKLTGLDFFAGLDDRIEESVEGTASTVMVGV